LSNVHSDAVRIPLRISVNVDGTVRIFDDVSARVDLPEYEALLERDSTKRLPAVGDNKLDRPGL